MTDATIQKPRKLTVRQLRFVDGFVDGKNATESARAAGFAESSIHKTAKRQLTLPAVIEEIDRRKGTSYQAEQLRVRPTTPDRILRAYAAIAFTPITDIVEWEDGVITIKDSKHLDALVALSIVEVKDSTEGVVSIKMTPRLPALEALAKHHGLFENKRTQGGDDDQPPPDPNAGSVFNQYNVVVTPDDIRDAFASLGQASFRGANPAMDETPNGTDPASIRPPQA